MPWLPWPSGSGWTTGWGSDGGHPLAGGEAEASRRLHAFLDQAVLDYGETRTFRRWRAPPCSPYLAAGIIGARQCVGALQQRLGYRPQSKAQPGFVWLNEAHLARVLPPLAGADPGLSMNRPFKAGDGGPAWSWDPDAFAAWCEGAPATPVVDAAMRCLNATGWMHNRLRMIVASFLTRISTSTGGSGRTTS